MQSMQVNKSVIYLSKTALSVDFTSFLFLISWQFLASDKDIPVDWTTFPPRLPHAECATPDKISKLYEEQKSNPAYRRLLYSNVTIFGTIDGS